MSTWNGCAVAMPSTDAGSRSVGRRVLLGSMLAALATLGVATPSPVAAQAQPAPAGQRPNIVVIFGDDVGQSNISAFTFGVMGYRTPNIDRLAREGMMFTDYYAEQSCTAGRSTFLTGQVSFRTGLSKVGADVTSNTYYDWVMSQPFIFMGANAAVTTLLRTFKEFPPSQRPATFGIDQALEVLKKAGSP